MTGSPIRDKYRRLCARWHLWRHSGDALNRRVAVEQYLLDCAAGRNPLPNADTCRELALKLGIPSRYQSTSCPASDVVKGDTDKTSSGYSLSLEKDLTHETK